MLEVVNALVMWPVSVYSTKGTVLRVSKGKAVYKVGNIQSLEQMSMAPRRKVKGGAMVSAGNGPSPSVCLV